jgi:hypothetical protein
MGDFDQLIYANAVDVQQGGADTGEAVEETWGVFNDEEHFEQRLKNGTIHPAMREKLVGEPLWTSPIPGPAKRYQQYFNEQREKEGLIPMAGYTVLKVQRRTVRPWRTIAQDTQEWADIDDGRRPNG